ncbi:MAG: hypothetical protein HY900_22500 [Deltaproteobacteria bacterium]|nr:hypothetical protein [Deltaproteobacteria bacterium]
MRAHWLTFFALAALLAGSPAAPAAEPLAQPGEHPIRYLYVVPHSHLDIGFNLSPQELIPLEKTYLDRAMEYAETYPSYRWTIESVWQLDQWKALTPDPAQWERLQQLMARGKISLAAGYANLHQSLAGPEELNRFVYPARVYEEQWGVTVETAFSNDVPGSSWALPQVLARSGVRNLVAGINTTFGGLPDLPVADSLFSWEGVEGSAVLTWVSRNSYAEGIFDYWLSAAYADMQAHTQAMIDSYVAGGYSYDAILVLEAFDNDGPDTILGALGNIDRWNREHTFPQILVATADDFFRHVREVHGDAAFTRYQGDWSGRWENLDTSTPVSTAQNRWVKEAAPQAETLAALASGLGVDFPYPAATLDRVYRNLLVFDEHSGPGGGFELTTEQIAANNAFFRRNTVQAYAGTEALLSATLGMLSAQIRADQPALVVYNGLAWPRSEVVPLTDGQLQALLATRPGARGGYLVDVVTGQRTRVQKRSEGGYAFYAAEVPALGYRLYTPAADATEPAVARRSGAAQLENDFYRVSVDPLTGNVASLYDKTNARELVDPVAPAGFNALVAAEQERAVVWGGWTAVPPGTVTVLAEVGPVESRLIVERSTSPLSHTLLTLPAQLPRVDVTHRFTRSRTRAVPRGDQTHWYYVSMPFALGSEGFIGRFQGPNGWLQPQRDWIPGTAHNARVSRQGTDVRAADGFGVTVANRESYLSSFGSTGFWNAGEPEAPALFVNLYARTDEALTTDRGWVAFDTWEPGAPTVYDFNFSLQSGTGGFDPAAAERFSAGFAAPLLVAPLATNAGGPLPEAAASLLSVSADHVAVGVLKRAEFENPDGRDLILRLREMGGRNADNSTVSLPFALEWAESSSLTEQRAGAVPLPASPLTVSLTPYQTLTVRLRPAAFSAFSFSKSFQEEGRSP